jgi:hypothetical protein
MKTKETFDIDIISTSWLASFSTQFEEVCQDKKPENLSKNEEDICSFFGSVGGAYCAFQDN